MENDETLHYQFIFFGSPAPTKEELKEFSKIPERLKNFKYPFVFEEHNAKGNLPPPLNFAKKIRASRRSG